jgi:hypothetical protein
MVADEVCPLHHYYFGRVEEVFESAVIEKALQLCR